jgi:hypothetical protein
MKRVLLTSLFVAAVAGIGLTALAWESDESPAPRDASSSLQMVSRSEQPKTESAARRLDRELHVAPESKRSVGEFELRRGMSVKLATATTVDGHWCLIDDQGPSGGAGSTCAENGPFARSKVLFSINTDGGPKRFTELYLLGVAAQDIRTVAVSRTDGSTVRAQPNAEGGFLFESSSTDLESRVFPSSLRLYGPSGRLVETVDIPSVG